MSFILTPTYTVQSSGSFTRPANTTAYVSGDLVGNAAAGAATLTFTGLTRSGGAGTGAITNARIQKSGTTTTNFSVILFLFAVQPTTTVADNGVFNAGNVLACNGSGNFMGTFTFPFVYGMSDGCSFVVPPDYQPVIPFVSPSAYGIVQILGSYTPAFC